MRIDRLVGIAALALSLGGVSLDVGRGEGGTLGVREAQAGKSKKSRKSKKRSRKSKKRRGYFSGHGVSRDELRTGPVERGSGDVWIFAENFREELKVNIYQKAPAPSEDGAASVIGAGDPSYDEEALAQLDHVFRCKRTGESRAVEPRLYEVLSVIQAHFDGRRIELVSGFRYQEGEGSRHFHASAVDFRIPGVSNRELYKFAESLDGGGMGIGIYPRSEFVHVDFRAPGEPSYRWTDRSPPGSDSPGKRPSHRWRRPNS